MSNIFKIINKTGDRSAKEKSKNSTGATLSYSSSHNIFLAFITKHQARSSK
jgi:hypothetical protein